MSRTENRWKYMENVLIFWGKCATIEAVCEHTAKQIFMEE